MLNTLHHILGLPIHGQAENMGVTCVVNILTCMGVTCSEQCLPALLCNVMSCTMKVKMLFIVVHSFHF